MREKLQKIKVCILVSSLGAGGAEKSSAILSRMLHESGYEIVIVSILNNIVYEYRGRLVNLGLQTATRKGLSRKYKKFSIFKNLLQQEHFDYLIDTNTRSSFCKQWMINKFLYRNMGIIFVVHNYNLKNYFPNNTFLGHLLYKNAYQIVGVSRECVKHFREKFNLKKGICIYNAYDEDMMEKATEDIKLPESLYILSYGRILDEHKNYSFLVASYAVSKLPERGIKLYIIGDGPDRYKIQYLAKKLGVEKQVVFQGFMKNPFPFVKNALFTTLTSNYEGFPMVLIESVAMKTPVVAVDCKSGPSEIVITGENGILVPFKDQNSFVEALNKMVENTDFYQKCKKGTIPSIQQFEKERILPQWKEILKPIVS